MCGFAVVAVCDVWARARARAVGGVRIAIVRGHVSVVVIEIVIIRAREASQDRGRVSPSVDTNDRRGGGGVSGGYEASIAVIQAEVQVVLQQRSCARVRVEQEGTAQGFAKRLSLGHVMVIMVVVGEVQDDWGSVPSGGKRDMIMGLGLVTGEEAFGVPRSRACAGRAKLSGKVRTSRLGSLRGPLGTRVAGV